LYICLVFRVGSVHCRTDTIFSFIVDEEGKGQDLYADSVYTGEKQEETILYANTK